MVYKARRHPYPAHSQPRTTARAYHAPGSAVPSPIGTLTTDTYLCAFLSDPTVSLNFYLSTGASKYTTRRSNKCNKTNKTEPETKHRKTFKTYSNRVIRCLPSARAMCKTSSRQFADLCVRASAP